MKELSHYFNTYSTWASESKATQDCEGLIKDQTDNAYNKKTKFKVVGNLSSLLVILLISKRSLTKKRNKISIPFNILGHFCHFIHALKSRHVTRSWIHIPIYYAERWTGLPTETKVDKGKWLAQQSSCSMFLFAFFGLERVLSFEFFPSN